jgi:hypothetical protein
MIEKKMPFEELIRSVHMSNVEWIGLFRPYFSSAFWPTGEDDFGFVCRAERR